MIFCTFFNEFKLSISILRFKIFLLILAFFVISNVSLLSNMFFAYNNTFAISNVSLLSNMKLFQTSIVVHSFRYGVLNCIAPSFFVGRAKTNCPTCHRAACYADIVRAMQPTSVIRDCILTQASARVSVKQSC